MNPTTGMSDGGASVFYQGVKLWHMRSYADKVQ